MNTPERSVVLVTCEYPPFPGGIATYAYGVASSLVNNGCAAKVVAPSYPDIPSETETITVHRVLGHHKIGLSAVLKTLAVLRAAPKGTVVLAADIRTVLMLYCLRPVSRKNYRAMVHGSEAAKFKKGSLLFALVRKAYMSAELVAYNSQATRDIFRRGIGAPENEAVTYLGVDPTWFVTVPGPFRNPQLAAIPEGTPVFCSVGRIEPRKGQLETVRAFGLAKKKYGLTDAVYVVAGRPEDDRYTEEVVREAEALSVELIMTGRLEDDDLHRLFRRSTCHCLLAQDLPGKIEGFGLVLLEAAAQMCPTLASKVGGIPEVLANTGALVNSDDLDGAAKMLARSASEPARRKVEGELASKRASEFTWDACAAKTFHEYFSHHSK